MRKKVKTLKQPGGCSLKSFMLPSSNLKLGGLQFGFEARAPYNKMLNLYNNTKIKAIFNIVLYMVLLVYSIKK